VAAAKETKPIWRRGWFVTAAVVVVLLVIAGVAGRAAISKSRGAQEQAAQEQGLAEAQAACSAYDQVGQDSTTPANNLEYANEAVDHATTAAASDSQWARLRDSLRDLAYGLAVAGAGGQSTEVRDRFTRALSEVRTDCTRAGSPLTP
jgi:hypothetical protein